MEVQVDTKPSVVLTNVAAPSGGGVERFRNSAPTKTVKPFPLPKKAPTTELKRSGDRKKNEFRPFCNFS
jgi:hypothetical protein